MDFKVQSAYLFFSLSFVLDWKSLKSIVNFLEPKATARRRTMEGERTKKKKNWKTMNVKEWILRMEQKNQIYCCSFTLLLYFQVSSLYSYYFTPGWWLFALKELNR